MEEFVSKSNIIYTHHPVQEKTTLWVNPLKNNNMHLIGTVFEPFCYFFKDEPIGSFSPVQGAYENDSSKVYMKPYPLKSAG